MYGHCCSFFHSGQKRWRMVENVVNVWNAINVVNGHGLTRRQIRPMISPSWPSSDAFVVGRRGAGNHLLAATGHPKRACHSERSEESEAEGRGFHPYKNCFGLRPLILRLVPLNDTTRWLPLGEIGSSTPSRTANLPRWLLLAYCLLPFSGYAQTSASAILNRPVVETGDTFTLRVLVGGTQVEPKKVDFAAWYATSFSPENVLSQSAWSRSGGRWVQEFTLITFDSATLRLPPLTVRLHLRDSVLTNPLELAVRPTSAKADVRTAETIRDIRREPVHWTDYWLEALCVALFVSLVVWYFRRKKTPPPVLPSTPPPPPPTPVHELILEQLAALERQKLWKQGQVVQFYAELSLIVRTYLERRFGVAALESTTREILPMLKNTDFPSGQSEALRNLLQEADMAKYADRLPPEQSCENAIAAARRLVIATGR